MHVVHAPRAAALVQVVDVLGDQEQVVAEQGLQPRQRRVRGVRLHPRESGPALVVEALHHKRVGVEGLRRGDILGPVPLPETVRVTERGQPALRGDTGTGEYDDLHAETLRSCA